MARFTVLNLLLTALVAVAGLSLTGSWHSVTAQAVQQIDTISFGTIALRSNSARERLVVNLNGTYSVTPNIIVVTPPKRAEFLATGFQPSTALSLSIQPVQLSEDGHGSGKTFDVTFSYLANISTDPTGSVTIYVGGTLETSGDGTPYGDQQYGATASMIVNY